MNRYKLSKVLFSITLAACVLTNYSVGVLAAGPEGPVGPQNPVGPQGPVGPTDPVGPQGPVGPESYNPTTSTAASSDTMPASGTGNSTTINNTGNDSANSVNNSNNSSTTVNNANTAASTTQANVRINTGDGNITNNSDANVTTGSIRATVTFVNIANSNLGDGSSIGTQNITGGNGTIALTPSTNRTTISNTGANSSNTVVGQNNSVVQINNLNNATHANTINASANTGNTNGENNTNLQYTSGNIEFGVAVINASQIQGPLAIDVYNVESSPTQNIIVPNTNSSITSTGSGSTNGVSNNTTKNATITTRNQADSANAFNIDTNTGGGTFNGNTNATAETGSTTINTGVLDVANGEAPQAIYVVNIYDPLWQGQVLGIDPAYVIYNNVSNTGADSNNQISNTNNQSLEVSNTNTASNNNHINISASTAGGNYTHNTSVKEKTGNITINAFVANLSNLVTSSGRRFVLGIINIFAKPSAGTSSPPPPSVATNTETAPGNQTSTSVQFTPANVQTVPKTDASTPSSGTGSSHSGTSGISSLPPPSSGGTGKTTSYYTTAHAKYAYSPSFGTVAQTQTQTWEFPLPAFGSLVPDALASEGSAAGGLALPHTTKGWYVLLSATAIIGLWGFTEFMAASRSRVRI